MKLRLIMQPLMACVMAVKAGSRDAREGRAPFFWSLISKPEHRRDMLKEGWKDIAKVFVACIVVDLTYQFIALRAVYPGEAVLVGILLALIPYLLVRGPVTRLAGARMKRL